ncbi:MMPL family transporter [Spirochaetota bacterium]
MLKKIAYYSVNFRYPIIAFWLITVGLLTWLAPNLSEVSISDQSAYLSEKEPSIQAQKLIKKHFSKEVFSNSVVIVLESQKGPIKNDKGLSVIRNFTGWIKSRNNPKISDTILSPIDPNLRNRLISPDGSVALIFVGINGAPNDTAFENTMRNFKQHMKELPAGYRGYVTGDAEIYNSYKECILESAEKTIVITILLVIICLLVIYRSPILPLVPLITIGVAYGISRAIIAWFAMHGMVVSPMTDLFMVVLLFGAGTDYCLFIISRFKEYMADGLTGPDAVINTMTRVGETIASSAGTIIVADIALSFVSVKLFSSTGPSLALAMVIGLCAVMTLSPSILSIIGIRAFWPGKPRHANESKFWGRTGKWITRIPWVPLALSLSFLIPFAFYGQGQKQTFDMLSDLPKDNMARVGYNILASKFGSGEMMPVDVIITDQKGIHKPSGIAGIAKTTEKLLKTPGVYDVRSLTSPGGKTDGLTTRLFHVDFQLNQIANQVDAFSRAMKAPKKLNKQIYSSRKRFKILNAYFTGLAKAFPGLSSHKKYKSVNASLGVLKKKINSSFELLKVPGQLAEIEVKIKKLKSTDPEIIVPQLSMLKKYFRGLVKSVPGASGMNGYGETISSLNELHKRFVEFKGMSAVTRTFAMLKQKSKLKKLKATLSKGLSRLTGEAKIKLADTIYVPPVLPKDTKKILNLILKDIKVFQRNTRILSQHFTRQKMGFYIPVELARLQEGKALKMLLHTYTSKEGNAVRYQLLLKDEPFSPAAMDTVKEIRKLNLPAKFHVGGNIPVLTDVRDAMKRDTVLMWFLVCGGITLVLIFLLRSLSAPIYLLGTIILSYNACMGIMRFIFEFLLGKEIIWFVPFFMFVLLLALGMDYNIFLMGRVREEVAIHGTRRGVRNAVLHTGGIITSAGIIMAGTFAAMMSSTLLGLVQLGFAITVGVLMDTFIIRTFLVPSIVVLLDKWNWWPGRLVKKQVE